MKRILFLCMVAAIIQSCMVQQVQVNTKFQSFSEGGRIFGEKTTGKEFSKGYTWFVIGINVLDCDSRELAKESRAESYTVETKHTFFSYLVTFCTGGILSYKKVKVIKRQS